jgi:hypothetical protein
VNKKDIWARRDLDPVGEVSEDPMNNNNSVIYAIIFALLSLVPIVALNMLLTSVYGQEGAGGGIETDNEISSQLQPGLINESIPLIGNQNDTSMSNFSDQGVEEFNNITTPLQTNESLLTGNESLPTEEDVEVEDELLDENVTTDTEMTQPSDNASELLGEEQVENLSQAEQGLTPETQPSDNASELLGEEQVENLSQAEQGLTPEIDQKLETAAASTVGITNATGGVENEQITNVQQVINNIVTAGSQGGGDVNVIVNQISQLVMNNSNGPVAVAMKKLAQEYSNGNIDEIDIATQQIGTQIAQGKNIEQTLVQITNNVINNIKNVKISIDNYDKIIVHPKTLDVDKKIITETITTIKKSKTIVDVPRIHIKFDNDEKNLVLRVLNTNDAKYEMPFSKNKGAFTLDNDEFRVKVIGGKGKIQTGSVAKMLGDGKVGDREFLDKEKRNGKVYFNLDEIEGGKYLLEVYIKLSDGSIGIWARGSVTITK